MKALVTGSSGFVGRHMIIELKRRGYETYGIDTVMCHGDDASSADHPIHDDAVNHFRYSVMKYDLVVHCAYHVGGRAAINGHSLALAKNLMLDSAMFDWAIRTEQPRVLYFSSSAAYPTFFQRETNHVALSEDLIEFNSPMTRDATLIMPDGRYGWAKLTGEQMAAAAQLAGLRVHVVRPFSGYGSDQSLDYPFPMFVDRVLKRVPQFTIWGSDRQTRDWIHIDDVIQGALTVVDRSVTVPVNLGTGVGTSMRDLASLMMLQAGHEAPIEVHSNMPIGVMHRVADISHMSKYFMPTISLEEGVGRALKERTRD